MAYKAPPIAAIDRDAYERAVRDTRRTGRDRGPRTGLSRGGLEPLPLPAAGYVRLRAPRHHAIGLVAELIGPVTVTGFAQLEATARPQDLALNRYGGQPPLALTLPLLIERWDTQKSVEGELRMLGRMGGLDPDLRPAPALIVEGLGVPHSYERAPELRWGISGDPAWGEIRHAGRDGRRSYVEVTITLGQIVRPGDAAETDDPGFTGARRVIVVTKNGPRTQRAIAHEYRLGSWPELRKLNPRLPADPDKTLRVDTQVRIA